MKPVIKYRGGKRSEIPLFKTNIPKEFDTYLEPFFGGGAVFFHLEPKKAIINDINKNLYQFYYDLQNNYVQLKKELKELQTIYEENQEEYELKKKLFPQEKVPNKNEELYYLIREEYNYPTGKWLPGTVYFFINKTAYSGMIRFNKKGEFNVPFGRYKNFNTDLIEEAHSKLLKNTIILNGDYEKVFERASKNDFMFLDPPYDCVFSEYGNEVFTGDFDEKEHERLAENFKSLECKAMMIISKTDLIKRLYKDFIVGEYDKNYSVNIRNRFKNDAVHYIIQNYESTLPLKEKDEQLQLIF